MHALEEAAVDTFALRYYALVSFAILYYDYLLTLPMEIERYWQFEFETLKWHWGASLFFFVRYTGVYGHIPVIIFVFLTNRDDAPCDALSFYHQIYAVAIQLSVGVLLIIRTYALYDCNKWVLRITSTIALLGTAVACWGVVAKHDSPPVEPPIVGCNSSLSNLQGDRLAIAWGGLLIFDTIIFSLTTYKAFTINYTGRRTLFDVLLRDGAIYFGCMGVANLSNIISFVVGKPLIKGISTTFTNVLAITLMSRLMLNIRDPEVLRDRRIIRSSSGRINSPLPTSMAIVSSVYYAGNAFMSGETTILEQVASDNEVELSNV